MSTQGYGATGLAGGPFTVSNPPPGKRFGSFINGRKQIIWLQARTTLAAAMSAARSGNPEQVQRQPAQAARAEGNGNQAVPAADRQPTPKKVAIVD